MRANSHNAKTENGVAVAGVSAIVHPAAKAGPALRLIVPTGEFRGVIAAQMPTDLLRHDDPLFGLLRRDRVAEDALALLAEPLR